MTDERRPKGRIMSADSRALIGRKTPVHGVPTHVDPELTPPPQAPPIYGDVHQRLDQLADGLGQVTDAIGKVWKERGNSDRLSAQDEKLDQIQTSINAWVSESVRHTEQIKALSTSIGAVVSFTEGLRTTTVSTSTQLSNFFEREWPRHEKLMERFEKALEDIAGRITRLETAVSALRTSDDVLAARLTANEASVNALDVRHTALTLRVVEIERSNREGQLVKDTTAEVHKKWFTWTRAALFGAGGVVMFVVKELGLLG
jgi:chromosome segregation ATPase